MTMQNRPQITRHVSRRHADIGVASGGIKYRQHPQNQTFYIIAQHESTARAGQHAGSSVNAASTACIESCNGFHAMF